jgi:hypothetical protein
MEDIVELDNLKSGKDIVTAAGKAAEEAGLALKVKKSFLGWDKVYLMNPGVFGKTLAKFQIYNPLELYSSFWCDISKNEDVACDKFLKNLGKYLGTTAKFAW